ncbi:unnamed protein product [Effrenium voratum]|nr:unnamed protein product [Effrenium voratum]
MSVFSVSTAGGATYEVAAAALENVMQLRLELEKQIEVPDGCYLKLFHSAEVLQESQAVSELDAAQPIFAVVARETDVEKLLEAASSFKGYKELLKAASSPEGAAHAIRIIHEMPSILAVLEDMGGQPANLEHLRSSEHGLEMSTMGHLLLPALKAEVLLNSARKERFSKVVFRVQLNSDAYDRGLGVVVVQSPFLDRTLDSFGLPAYIFNGFGLSEDKNSNAIKFHPGLRGGQLRVEGVGGFGNSEMGFTPKNWTQSGHKFHSFVVTIGADGENQLEVVGTEGEIFRKVWKNLLTDGKHLPALHGWLDLGQGTLMLGKIGLEVHL